MPHVRAAPGAAPPEHPIDALLAGCPNALALRDLKSLLGVGRNTVFRWIQECGFPPAIWVAGNRRWAKDAVRSWLISEAGKRKRDHLEKMRGGRRARA
jgi:predicted DNA-binding transcriptional regulator AlpA